MDKDLILPNQFNNSKKPVIKLIRHHLNKSENEDIKNQFESFTDLDLIEKEIFSDQGEYLPIRIFIKHNVSEK